MFFTSISFKSKQCIYTKDCLPYYLHHLLIAVYRMEYPYSEYSDQRWSEHSEQCCPEKNDQLISCKLRYESKFLIKNLCKRKISFGIRNNILQAWNSYVDLTVK